MKKDSNNFSLNKEYSNKKFLYILKKEIKGLEFDVSYPQLLKLKNITVRNFKITLKGLQFLAPYILCASISVGITKVIGLGYPFYSKDQVRENKRIVKQVDSVGNVRKVEQYRDYVNAINILEYCSKWKEDKDGYFYRDVEVYKIGNLTENDVEDVISGKKSDIKSIFGNPVSSKKEIKNNVSTEELEQDSYIKVIMYFENKNEYIMRTETFVENFGASTVFVMIASLFSIIPATYQSSKNYNFISDLKCIKENYSSIDIKEVKKKLKIKKENYERLIK